MTDTLRGFFVFEFLITFQRIYGWFPKAYAKLDNTSQPNVTPALFVFSFLAKMLTQLDALKQQSSNSTEMTSERYVSIKSFHNVFTVSQTALVKLIVIANCKGF